jgi:transglutaminase-like putative cysteine protease
MSGTTGEESVMGTQPIEKNSSTPSASSSMRRYEIVDEVTLAAAPSGAERYDLWCPLIPDTPYQRVVAVRVHSSVPWTAKHEAEHGNRILHTHIAGVPPAPATVRICYTIERRARVWTLDSAVVRPLEASALFLNSLRPERFVDVDERTRRLAREVVGSEPELLERARRIYEYVAGTMTYNAEAQSWKGSTSHALACSTGNCNDIHALFISLCRSVGIPARLVLGQALETPPSGAEACEVCGYHCWAEFFVGGLGWVPADASCACKYAKDHLFGDLELNHVAWSMGRDIELEPVQQGGRLLFFAGPYAEADGVPHRGVERRIRFVEIPAEVAREEDKTVRPTGTGYRGDAAPLVPWLYG